jgi:hypothetical protein
MTLRHSNEETEENQENIDQNNRFPDLEQHRVVPKIKVNSVTK